MLVRQRTLTDCAIASMAMMLGRDYDDVLRCVGDCYDEEIGTADIQKAMERLGYNGEYQYGSPIGDFIILIRPHCISAEYFRKFAWGRRALMSVPSLNKESSLHMLYFDGNEVRDPSLQKVYKKFEQLLPFEIVLMRR